MSENIAAAIAAKNAVIAQQGEALDEIATLLETKAAGGGTDLSLGLTSAEWETAEMASGGGEQEEYELVFQETVASDVMIYTRDKDKDGNPFSLTDAVVIIFTKPFAESTNEVGRGLGFLPTTTWGVNKVCGISDSLPAGTTSVGRYDVIHAKVINGYQVVKENYRSQNTTNVFGNLMPQTGAALTGFYFYTDENRIMEIGSPQGNMTCVKIVSYSDAIAAGSIITLYKRKGT